MSSINKVILVGRVGRDAEVRFTPGGDAVANFSMATSETWKDKEGEKQERTEWHRITAWGPLAEMLGEHLKKGALVYVEGSIRTQKYTDKNDVEKESKDIKIDTFKFLARPPGESGSGGGGQRTQQQRPAQGGGKGAADPFEDDIPF